MDKNHLIFVTGFLVILSLTACLPDNPTYKPTAVLSPTPFPTNTPLPSAAPAPTTTVPAPTLEGTAAPTPTAIPVPGVSPTRVPSPSPIPVLVSQDTVNVPILLYHHIADYSGAGQEYYVGVDAFRNQMGRLKDWGYTTLTISDLAAAIRGGSSLPSRPIVITFDDGNLDVYQNALPVLNAYGFKAVMYVIANSIGSGQNLSISQIQDMASAAWEIGSHSYTHANLLKSENLQKEICLSRYDLARATGLEVRTFAYPYGLADRYVTQFARDCGYTSAAGLGPSIRQSADDLYYLNRLTVQGGWTLDEFAAQLPWGSP